MPTEQISPRFVELDSFRTPVPKSPITAKSRSSYGVFGSGCVRNVLSYRPPGASPLRTGSQSMRWPAAHSVPLTKTR